MIEGVYVPLLTAFTEEGDVDVAACVAHAEWAVDRGVNGLVPFGTSGEVSSRKRPRAARVAASPPIYTDTADFATIMARNWTRDASSTGRPASPSLHGASPARFWSEWAARSSLWDRAAWTCFPRKAFRAFGHRAAVDHRLPLVLQPKM